MGGNKFGTLKIPAGAQQLVVQNSNITTIEIIDTVVYDLQQLIVSNNSIRDISSLGKLVNLEVLDLSSNPVQTLPTQVFQNLRKLKKLNIHECEIIEIYEDIFIYLIQLEYLDVSSNPLKTFDLKTIQTCTNLQTLNLESCDLTEILNYELIRTVFPNLKEIYLSNNNWECNYLKTLVDIFRERGIRVVVQNPVPTSPNYEGIACTLSNDFVPPLPPNKNVEEIDTNQVEMLQPGAGTGGKYIAPAHGGVQPPKYPYSEERNFQKPPVQPQLPGSTQGGTTGTNSFSPSSSQTIDGHMYNPYKPGNVQPGINNPAAGSNWNGLTPQNQISPEYQPGQQPTNPTAPLSHHQVPGQPQTNTLQPPTSLPPLAPYPEYLPPQPQPGVPQTNPSPLTPKSPKPWYIDPRPQQTQPGLTQPGLIQPGTNDLTGSGSQNIGKVVNPPCDGGPTAGGDVSCPYQRPKNVLIGQGSGSTNTAQGNYISGGDVPPPNSLTSGNVAAITCCDELNELKLKVYALEQEIAEIKKRSTEHVEAALARKSQEIELNLKEMVIQLIEQKQRDVANTVHSYQRFGNY